MEYWSLQIGLSIIIRLCILAKSLYFLLPLTISFRLITLLGTARLLNFWELQFVYKLLLFFWHVKTITELYFFSAFSLKIYKSWKQDTNFFFYTVFSHFLFSQIKLLSFQMKKGKTRLWGFFFQLIQFFKEDLFFVSNKSIRGKSVFEIYIIFLFWVDDFHFR